MGLIVPRHAVPRQAESAVARDNAEIIAQVEAEAEKLNYFNYELAKIDPDLKVVMAKPGADHPDIKPGYYHLIRVLPQGAYIRIIEDPVTGEWRDLDSSIFQIAQEDDLWNDRTQRELAARRKRADEARQKAQQREAMERAHDFDERLHNAMTTQISVPKAVK